MAGGVTVGELAGEGPCPVAALLLSLVPSPPAMTETREPTETGGYASLEEDDEDLSPGEALEVAVLTKLSSWAWFSLGSCVEEWLLALLPAVF